MNDAATTLEAADIAGILKALPHRYPFLMIDRIIDIRGDECADRHQERDLQRAAVPRPFSQAIRSFPGVLMIEGMAQTAGVICLRAIGAAGKPLSVFFLTIDKAKFRKPVVPGDTLEYHMTKIARKKNMWWFRGEAKVAGQMVAEAEVGAMIVGRVKPMAEIDPTARVETGAVIGPDATIGPYCVIGPNVVIGEGCRLVAHVHLTGHTTIGRAP